MSASTCKLCCDTGEVQQFGEKPPAEWVPCPAGCPRKVKCERCDDRCFIWAYTDNLIAKSQVPCPACCAVKKVTGRCSYTCSPPWAKINDRLVTPHRCELETGHAGEHQYECHMAGGQAEWGPEPEGYRGIYEQWMIAPEIKVAPAEPEAEPYTDDELGRLLASLQADPRTRRPNMVLRRLLDTVAKLQGDLATVTTSVIQGNVNTITALANERNRFRKELEASELTAQRFRFALQRIDGTWFAESCGEEFSKGSSLNEVRAIARDALAKR